MKNPASPNAPDVAPPRRMQRGLVSTLLAANLRRAQVSIYQHFEAWFEDDDMTPLQFSTLNLIDLNPGISQKYMASHMRVERASFGECLARLENKGLIRRGPDPRDGRAKVMELTWSGREVLARLLAGVRAQERDYASALSDAEHQQLLDLLQKMTR